MPCSPKSLLAVIGLALRSSVPYQDKTDERRLRLAYQVAALMAEGDSDEVVQSWFQGLNPQLEDRLPARLLREGDLDEVGLLILAAARSFVATG